MRIKKGGQRTIRKNLRSLIARIIYIYDLKLPEASAK